jgi:hypothetical protein
MENPSPSGEAHFFIVAERLVIPANPPEADKSRNPEKMELCILDAPGLPIAGAGLSGPA